MWVFGYGSLMWDGWEREFTGSRIEGAVLRSYRRAFNKKSERNWGTRTRPGPTLGLEPDQSAECVGTVFEFDDDKQAAVFATLRQREGPSFELSELPIRLSNGRVVLAFTSINARNDETYIGDIPLKERAAMAKVARGSDGACVDYARNIHRKLRELGITDENVEEFVTMFDLA